MNEVTVTGKTVEDAVDKALELLGAVREEVDVVVLENEKKGMFGFGSTEAKVRVTLNYSPVDKGEAFLCQLLNAMGVDDYEVAVEAEDETVLYSVTSEGDVGFIIGYHGDALDALSAVVSLAVNKDTDTHYRISVDLNGYRAKRIESVREYAQRAVKKAQESGYVTVANPMKPYERMLIHTEVQDTMDVVSWSEGDEPYRRVIIAPISKVKKVGDHYERTDRNDRSDRPPFRGGRDNDRGGRGRNDRGGRSDKYRPAESNRPARSDFSDGSLYGKIEPKKDGE